MCWRAPWLQFTAALPLVICICCDKISNSHQFQTKNINIQYRLGVEPGSGTGSPSVDSAAVRLAPDQVLVPGQKRAKREADVDGDVPQHVRRQEDVTPPSAHKALGQTGRLDAETESEGAEGEGLSRASRREWVSE